MLEKTTRMNLLFDFYQDLLTEKQKIYISLYYLDDLSLAEIANEFKVSRQAVYDNIKRTEEILENYEKKLGMVSKYLDRTAKLENLEQILITESRPNKKALTLIEELKSMD